MPGKLQQYTIRKSKQYTINISRYFVFMLTIFTGLDSSMMKDSHVLFTKADSRREIVHQGKIGILIENIFT